MKEENEPRWNNYLEHPGIAIEYPTLKWQETIVSFDGEDILSLWSDGSGIELYMKLACEETNNEPWGERYLLYLVSYSQVKLFENGEVTNRDLILSSTKLILVEETWKPANKIATLVKPEEVYDYVSLDSSYHPKHKNG